MTLQLRAITLQLFVRPRCNHARSRRSPGSLSVSPGDRTVPDPGAPPPSIPESKRLSAFNPGVDFALEVHPISWSPGPRWGAPPLFLTLLQVRCLRHSTVRSTVRWHPSFCVSWEAHLAEPSLFSVIAKALIPNRQLLIFKDLLPAPPGQPVSPSSALRAKGKRLLYLTISSPTNQSRKRPG